MLFMLAAPALGLIHDENYYIGKYTEWIKEFGHVSLEWQDILNDGGQTSNFYSSRFKSFAENNDIIESHNSQQFSYKLGHNQFSLLRRDEFRQKYLDNSKLQQPGLLSSTLPLQIHSYDQAEVLAKEIDWVTAGAVTKVKDQGAISQNRSLSCLAEANKLCFRSVWFMLEFLWYWCS